MASPALYKDLSPPDLTAHRRSGSVAMARIRLLLFLFFLCFIRNFGMGSAASLQNVCSLMRPGFSLAKLVSSWTYELCVFSNVPIFICHHKIFDAEHCVCRDPSDLCAKELLFTSREMGMSDHLGIQVTSQHFLDHP